MLDEYSDVEDDLKSYIEYNENLKSRFKNDLDLKSHYELEVRDKNRLEAFVDAVFAIAITLLVLEFVIPVMPHSNVSVLNFIENLVPKLLGYFLAFFLLGMLLNIHNRQFRNIRYGDQKLWWINLLFLSFIVLVPFLTTILTEYGDTTIGVLFFHLNMFISGTILTLHWYYLKNRNYLLKKNITSRTMTLLNYKNFSIPLASLIAIIIAFFSPILSNAAYLIILLIIFISPFMINKLERKKI